jgi:hypothetical protein
LLEALEGAHGRHRVPLHQDVAALFGRRVEDECAQVCCQSISTITQSLNHSINLLINQINQSINQLTNQINQ